MTNVMYWGYCCCFKVNTSVFGSPVMLTVALRTSGLKKPGPGGGAERALERAGWEAEQACGPAALAAEQWERRSDPGTHVGTSPGC